MNAANPNIQIRSGPVFLVTLVSGDRYLAVRIDETPNVLKIIGVTLLTEPNIDLIQFIKDLPTTHAGIISACTTSDFIEISFPWHQIVSLQSLAYRHKGNR